MTDTPRWTTILRLAARGGRSDVVRIALTATGSAAASLALLCGATVAYTGPDDGPYTSALLQQPGLHLGIVIAFALLSIPVLGFVAQCSRVGAPARDRRLAAFRMAGVTPRDVLRIVAAETGLGAGLGSLLGLGLYALARALLNTPVAPTGQHTAPTLRLPTDVLPPGWVIGAIVLAIPLGATLLSRIALRQVVFSPVGVVRRATPRPPRLLPAALFLIGVAGMTVISTVARLAHLDGQPAAVQLIVFMVLFATTSIGLAQGTAALAARIGASLAPRVRRPALLLAGRRLVADPYNASRTNAVLLVAVLIGGLAQGIRVAILTDVGSGNRDFYNSALDLVNVALAVGIVLAAGSILVSATEGVVTRRRSLAVLAATGTPRATLRRAVIAETLIPLLPTSVLACASGLLVARSVYGTRVETATYDSHGGTVRGIYLQVPVPWIALTVVIVGALLATTAVTCVALLFLRGSVDVGELRAPA